MSESRFVRRLKQNRPLLFDGAMGTYFAQVSHLDASESELAVLSHPDIVLNIHQAYLDAGAEALKTDTFSLPAMLADPDQAASEKVIEELVAKACELASKACQKENPQAFVFADLGPVPDGPDRKPQLIYEKLACLFLQNNVDHFLIETLPDLEGIAEFAQKLKALCPEAVLMVSIAAGPDGMTRKGFTGRSLITLAAGIPEVDAVGFNCLSGPLHELSLLKDLPALDKPVSVMPNAGYLNVISRRASYSGTPEYFAVQMLELAAEGAAILGGCCGTTPEHIRLTKEALNSADPKLFESRKNQENAAEDCGPDHEQTEEGQPPRAVPGILEHNLKAGRKSILVELDPPENDSIAFFLEGVAALKKAGADMITIADNPIGRPRADSSILACKIRRELDMDVLPHITCRDRNLNAIRALLLGLSIENVHHVLVVTGDPLPTEVRDEVKTVFSFNSRTLARYIRTLSKEKICSPFHVFGALDVNARNFRVQLRLAKEKEQNGVEAFLTQPVLSKRALDNLCEARKQLKGEIYAGLFPIVSYKNALFLKNEISGMDIPDELTEQYKGLNRQEAEELAIQITADLAGKARDLVDGYYLMTPFKRTALVASIIEELDRRNLLESQSPIPVRDN